jgi:hypothetical protein
MPARLLPILHLVIGVAWMGAALVLALAITLSGTRASALAAQRGSDLAERLDIDRRQERIRAALDYEASPPHLAAAVRAADLPLAAPAPTRFAAR